VTKNSLPLCALHYVFGVIFQEVRYQILLAGSDDKNVCFFSALAETFRPIIFLAGKYFYGWNFDLSESSYLGQQQAETGKRNCPSVWSN
jgi:hypothetical protein